MHHRPRLDGTADTAWVSPWGDPLSDGTVRLGLCALLFACGLAQAVLIYMWAPWIKAWLLFHGVYALGTAAVIFVLARTDRALPAPRRAVPVVVLGGFVATIVLAQVAMQSFPNSGDEYGYGYLADTLLHGRLWNEPLPDDLLDVFKTQWIADRGGKRISQYAPGWPAVLAGFKLAGLAEFANPLLGLLASALLWLCLRRVPAAVVERSASKGDGPRSVPPSARRADLAHGNAAGGGARLAALALGTLAPFTLFNNASFYAHTLTAAALLGVIWLDLRDAEAPSAWNRVGIGFAFSVLLVTRYEAFLVASALFSLDGLLRKRARFVTWALPAAVAGLPLAVALLWYNWRITGNPMQTTLSWATPWITYGPYSVGVEGQHSPMRGLRNTLIWGLGWHDFASVLLLPLYAAALWRRISSAVVRWFDLLLPAFVVFFFFFPDSGGFQHGPRYFYLAHAALPVTIAAGLAAEDGLWRLGRWGLDPVRLAAAQFCAFAGFTLGYAISLHQQAELRLIPSRVAATAPAPAVVLVGGEPVFYLRWQKRPSSLWPADFTRNGVDGFGPVVVGIYTNDRRAMELCAQMPDRRVFRLVLQGIPPVGHLQPICN